ncbi:hypothetical protein EGW08_017529 [Elysia chlorotica]|uniref:EF-hand domain-containing protein n=1 Tax=Elysia chlorotica TaxID=188477 RepID=A0A3S1B2R6_ELYCH|nr:hypothetical protein EGW08_017529 [Elysia chlorotica]
MTILTRAGPATLTSVVHLTAILCLFPSFLSAPVASNEGAEYVCCPGRPCNEVTHKETLPIDESKSACKFHTSAKRPPYATFPAKAFRNRRSSDRRVFKDKPQTRGFKSLRTGLTQKRSREGQGGKQKNFIPVLIEVSAKQKKDVSRDLMSELLAVNKALNKTSSRFKKPSFQRRTYRNRSLDSRAKHFGKRTHNYKTEEVSDGTRYQKISSLVTKMLTKAKKKVAMTSYFRYRFRDKRREGKIEPGEDEHMKGYVWNENLKGLPAIGLEEDNPFLDSTRIGQGRLLEYETLREMLKRANASTLPDIVEDLRLYLQWLIRIMLNFLIQEAPSLFQQIVSQKNVRLEDLDFQGLIDFSEFLVGLAREMDLDKKRSRLERMPLTFG